MLWYIPADLLNTCFDNLSPSVSICLTKNNLSTISHALFVMVAKGSLWYCFPILPLILPKRAIKTWGNLTYPLPSHCFRMPVKLTMGTPPYEGPTEGKGSFPTEGTSISRITALPIQFNLAQNVMEDKKGDSLIWFDNVSYLLIASMDKCSNQIPKVGQPVMMSFQVSSAVTVTPEEATRRHETH